MPGVVAVHQLAGVVQGPAQLVHYLITGAIHSHHLVLRLTVQSRLHLGCGEEGWLLLVPAAPVHPVHGGEGDISGFLPGQQWVRIIIL